jgi:hypothetical protein
LHIEKKDQVKKKILKMYKFKPGLGSRILHSPLPSNCSRIFYANNFTYKALDILDLTEKKCGPLSLLGPLEVVGCFA